jgi:hypothetical protein
VAADALYSRTLVQAKDAPGGEATTLSVVAEASTFMAWHADAERGSVPVAYGSRNQVVEFVALVDGQAATWLAANDRCVSAREWLVRHADRAAAARRSIGRTDAAVEREAVGALERLVAAAAGMSHKPAGQLGTHEADARAWDTAMRTAREVLRSRQHEAEVAAAGEAGAAAMLAAVQAAIGGVGHALTPAEVVTVLRNAAVRDVPTTSQAETCLRVLVDRGLAEEAGGRWRPVKEVRRD